MGAECTIVVCVIIISLKVFLHNFICYSFLFSVAIQIFVFFSNFSFFHETHTLALNRIAELGDIFQSVST